MALDIQARCRVEAPKLLAQRARLLAEPWADAGSLQRLEQRLQTCLSCLAGTSRNEAPPASDDTDPASWLVRLLSDPQGALPAVMEAAAADPEVGAVLALSPGPRLGEGDPQVLGAHARTAVALAAEAGTVLPDAVVNTALAADSDRVAAAAVATADNDPARDPGVFRSRYARLEAPRTACAAIRAGLMRGDEDAARALAPALERAPDGDAALAVLRLMALTGRAEHAETLRLYADREPVRGAPLLALHGAPAHLDALPPLLERAHGAGAAAAAWWRLTGTTLPEVPRLQVVDGDAAGGGPVPDAEWAAGWLAARRGALAGMPRLLFGEPLGAQRLAAACRRWAGREGAALLDQARMLTGPRLRARPAQWIVTRITLLDAAGLSPRPAPPADLATADPWAHGHYA